MKWRRGLTAEVMRFFKSHPDLSFTVLDVSRNIDYKSRGRLKDILDFLVEFGVLKADRSGKIYRLSVKKKR